MEYALLEPYLMKIIVSGSRDLMCLAEAKVTSFLEYVGACEKEVAKKGEKSSVKCLRSLSKVNVDLIKSEAAIIRGFL